MGVYRKNEKWWIDYYYLGKRRRQKIGTVKKDAEEALNKIKVKIAAGEFVPLDEGKRQASLEPQPVLFETFAVEDFLPWSEVTHSSRHFGNTELIVRVHLIPHFGEKDLKKINTKHLEDYLGKRSRSTYVSGKGKRRVKSSTVNRDIACIKLLFRKAVEWGKLEENPARGIKPLKEIPNPPRLLEQEEIVRLLEEVPDRLYALIACAVYAGLRKEELFHLRWTDINWKTVELTVASREDHHTKNYESRGIPINEPLLEALRRHPRRLGSPYVFCNRDGKTYDNIRTALRGAAKRAGIEGGVKLHQLRHAFCSHALMQGIDPRTVQKWMGHRDLKTTLRYAHVSPDHEKAAIQKLRYDHGHYMDTSIKKA